MRCLNEGGFYLDHVFQWFGLLGLQRGTLREFLSDFAAPSEAVHEIDKSRAGCGVMAILPCGFDSPFTGVRFEFRV